MKSPFSAGRLFGARTDVATQTPREFAILQSCSIEFDFTTKALYGKNGLAVFVARGGLKLPVKAQFATFSARVFNDLFFGQTFSTGGTQLAADEAHAVPATSPYTVSATNSSTFASDEGVFYTSGNQLQFVSSLTASGQYTVSGGVYTFSSTDASAAILLDYLYTTTGGASIALANPTMGVTPYFKGVFRNLDPSTGEFTTLVINRLTSSKLTINAKMNDFQLVDFEMEAMDDGTGNIGILTVGDTN